MTTAHLDVNVPDIPGEVADRFAKMAALMEAMYQAESVGLNEALTQRVRVDFQIDVIAGVAGTNWLGMAIGFSLDMSYTTIPSTFIGVASHEIGHVFQLSPPVSPPGYYVDMWFGEPEATLNGNLAIEALFGPRLALFDRGTHDHFLKHLQGSTGDLIEDIQFVLYYLKATYGIGLFQEFVRLWCITTGTKDLLFTNGFSSKEAVVVLLSYSAGENLGWVFEMTDLGVTTERIEYGLSLIPVVHSTARISSNAYNSVNSSVAVSGSYVYVAWSDSTPVSGSDGQPEVWLRVSSNNGATFGSPIRITTNVGSSAHPSVAASGSYVYVAWQDDTPVSGSGSKPEIWMRVSANYGVSFGSAIRMSMNVGNSCNPSVAADGSYVYVAWQDDTPVTGSAGHYEIWIRVSSNNGVSFGSAIRMSMNAYDSVIPSVTASLGYVYVAWADYTPVTGSGGQPEIWMRASGNSGASFGSPIRLSSNAYMSLYPSVAASGSYVYVTWQDHTPVVGSGGAPEVWMRVSSNNGASFGSAVRMSTNAYDSDYPRVAASGSNVYVVWMDDTPVTGSGGHFEVWLRVSSNNGASFGSAIRISTNTGQSEYPSLAFSGSYVYVAWDDNTPVSGSGGAPEVWLKVGT
jgi:hypothetical protein